MQTKVAHNSKLFAIIVANPLALIAYFIAKYSTYLVYTQNTVLAKIWQKVQFKETAALFAPQKQISNFLGTTPYWHTFVFL